MGIMTSTEGVNGAGAKDIKIVFDATSQTASSTCSLVKRSGKIAIDLTPAAVVHKVPQT